MSATVEQLEIPKETSEVESATTVTESSDQLDMEEEDIFFQDIDILLEHNIPLADITMLKMEGINTIKGLQMTMRKKLLGLKGFTNEKIDKIKELCCKVVLSNGFMTALEVSDQRKQIFKISTGSSNFE